MRNGIWAKFKSAVSKSHEIPTISVFGIWKSRTFEFSLMILRFDALSWLPKSWCLKTNQHMMFFFIVARYFSRPSFGSAVCWLCNSTRSKALLDVLTRGLLIVDQCLNISFVFSDKWGTFLNSIACSWALMCSCSVTAYCFLAQAGIALVLIIK